MLDEVMKELESWNGPVTVKELAHKLGVQESALTGMLEFLERKGRLTLGRVGKWEECTATLCKGCVFVSVCKEKDKEAGCNGDRCV